jgi:YCII-related domain
MAKFLYLYSGGEMAETPEAQQEQMQAWTAWFGTLGDSVVDIGTSRLGGYSIINAESLDEAATQAKGCPVLQSGGSVEVYEALIM